MERKSQIGYNISAKMCNMHISVCKNVHHPIDFGTNKNNYHFFITSEDTFEPQNWIWKLVSRVQNLVSLIKISEILNRQNKIYIFFREINTYSTTHSTDIVKF